MKRKFLAFVLFAIILVSTLAPAALAASTWTDEVKEFCLTQSGNYYTGNYYAIQRFLYLRGNGTKAALGGDSDDVDGVFGPKTTAAVKIYQSNKGLSADGIVGPNTWKNLYYDTTEYPGTYTYQMGVGTTEATELGMSTVMLRYIASCTWRSYNKYISTVPIY